ncbi:hypothetical protein ISN45_Aa06g004670 [Arabidopsis thaliana x Arabidopsis arenosa]|uniref:Uncharacterized protein n=1 Tax=Arabidopsis thaliana x Arabidopsis arenosa TaxID=1240361 RepID=A0A8T1YT00_9BRAS|nr:hypothetical protein ISN45_Aa06g004670 [Arabidopsis thaliana x Arabidopsis arenosa]
MAGENPQPRTKFIHIVASLEQVLDLKQMGFEDIVGRLLEYEERVGEETQSEDQGPQTLSVEATGSFKKETEAVITRRRYNRGSYNYGGYGRGSFGGDSSGRGMGRGKSTLQSQGGETDAGEGHEEDDVMEDITQDNHEDEVGEVVQGVPQLTSERRAKINKNRWFLVDISIEVFDRYKRGGVSRHLMKILNDMWGEAERHSSLLKAKKIMRPHLKMVDDWSRSVITRPHLKKVDDWSILEPSRVLMMLESCRILENIKPSRVMIFGYSVLVVEVVQRVLQEAIQGVEQEVCAQGILLAEVVHEVLHEVVQDVIQGAEQEDCVQGIVEVVQALVQEVIQGAEQEGDAQRMLVDTKMQSNLKLSNLKISKAEEEQEIVCQQRLKLRMFKAKKKLGSSINKSLMKNKRSSSAGELVQLKQGARVAQRSSRSSSSSYSRSSSEGSSEESS